LIGSEIVSHKKIPYVDHALIGFKDYIKMSKG